MAENNLLHAKWLETPSVLPHRGAIPKSFRGIPGTENVEEEGLPGGPVNGTPGGAFL